MQPRRDAFCIAGGGAALRLLIPGQKPSNQKQESRRMSAQQLTPERREEHWRKTRNLMLTILALWFFFSFFVHLFAVQLNEIVILGFPLGFYMAAQGSLIAFVVLCFWNSSAQNKIDEEFGVAED
jgi:putative solute:sodium symporter small subunit